MLPALCLLAIISCSNTADKAADNGADIKSRLTEWIKGVWISGDGTYTIYTDHHYFVISYEGDSSSPNIYCGSSQIVFHNKGMARKQNIRMRQSPGGEMQTFRLGLFTAAHGEAPLEIDTTLFVPGMCHIQDGIIYDAVTEVTDEYILLSTCNGDQEKIFADGRYAYLPADGGEFYSYRIEKL
jgi:hypothetical protein